MAHEGKSSGTGKAHTNGGAPMDVEFSLRGMLRGAVSADQSSVDAAVQGTGAGPQEGAGFASAEPFPSDLLEMIEMRTAGTRKAVVPVPRVVATSEGAAKNPWVHGEDVVDEAQGEIVVTVRRSVLDRPDYQTPLMPLRDSYKGGGKMTTASENAAIKDNEESKTPVVESTLPFGHLSAYEADEVCASTTTVMGEELAAFRDETPVIAEALSLGEVLEHHGDTAVTQSVNQARVELPTIAEEAGQPAASGEEWSVTADEEETYHMAAEQRPADQWQSTLIVDEAPEEGDEAAAADQNVIEGDDDMGKKKADKEKGQETLEGHDLGEAEPAQELTGHDEADETPISLAAREEIGEEISEGVDRPSLASLVDQTPHLAAKSGGVTEGYAPAKLATSDLAVKRGLVDLLNDLGSKKPETGNGSNGVIPQTTAVVAAPVIPTVRQVPVESLGAGVANMLGDGVRAVAAVGQKVTGNGVAKVQGANGKPAKSSARAPSSVTRSAVHGSSRDVGTGLRGVLMGVKQVGLGCTSMVTGTMGCLVGAVICVGQSIAGGFKEAIGKQPSEID